MGTDQQAAVVTSSKLLHWPRLMPGSIYYGYKIDDGTGEGFGYKGGIEVGGFFGGGTGYGTYCGDIGRVDGSGFGCGEGYGYNDGDGHGSLEGDNW